MHGFLSYLLDCIVRRFFNNTFYRKPPVTLLLVPVSTELNTIINGHATICILHTQLRASNFAAMEMRLCPIYRLPEVQTLDMDIKNARCPTSFVQVKCCYALPVGSSC